MSRDSDRRSQSMLAAMEEFALNAANMDIDDDSDSDSGDADTVHNDYEDEELAVVEDDDDENSDEESQNVTHNFIPSVLPNVVEGEEKCDETDSRHSNLFCSDEVSEFLGNHPLSPSGRSVTTSSHSTNWYVRKVLCICSCIDQKGRMTGAQYLKFRYYLTDSLRSYLLPFITTGRVLQLQKIFS
jgi:hypothetical protein